MSDTEQAAENKDLHSITSDEQEAVKAAFVRLGINIDDDGNSNSGTFIAGLNSAADKMEALEAENAKLTAAVDKAKSAPKASAAKAASVRKVGQMKPRHGDDAMPGRVPPEEIDGMLERIAAADQVEIVFSDGKNEIAGIPALTIMGDAWKKTVAGMALTGVDVAVHGPAHGQSAYQLHGYGLLLDGKQVAYATRPEVLNIGPGQQVNLSGDLAF